MTTLVLRPAYFRKVRSKKDALELWNKNRDFVIQNVVGGLAGKKINKQDFKNFIDSKELSGVQYINVRYNSDQSVAVFNVDSNGDVS